MIEPPSDRLQQTLLELRICSPRDFRRCRGRVKRLSRDLPAFDTVWIDALLQAGKLTPFQAQQLDSTKPQPLQVGPCVLIDRLGRGTESETFLARSLNHNERCVLKLIRQPDEMQAAVFARLEQLVERHNGFVHPSIVVPKTCLKYDDRLIAVSRYVPGPHLGELLVRRGRMPAEVVWQIGRQLVEGLAALEARGAVHGDIGLKSVRLTSAGTAVLVDAGLRPAVSELLTIHAGFPPERYDGTAPELIGTGRPADSRSDIYALGCLLWQLLAARPPFPTGDPLAKLACHQTRTIDDIREWVPDAPPALATAIARFTGTDPGRRPESFAEIRERWGPARRRSRRRLARFRATFNTSARRIPPATAGNRSSRWPMLAAVVFCLSGAAAALWDVGVGKFIPLATQGRQQPASAERDAEGRTLPDETTESTSSPSKLRPLPEPDASGVISLTAGQSYEAAEVAAVGPLVIQGPHDGSAEIVAGGHPLRVWAERCALENLTVRANGRSVPAALVLVEAQDLDVTNCRFGSAQTGSSDESHSSGRRPIALGWKPIDDNDPAGGRIQISHTVLQNGGPALFLATAARTLTINNCLYCGSGPLYTFGAAPAARSLHVELKNVTARQTTAVARWQPIREESPSGAVTIEATDCVFELVPPNGAFVQISGNASPEQNLPRIDLIGDGCLVNPQTQAAVWRRPDGSFQKFATDRFLLEGISAGAFEFQGPPGADPGQSTLKTYPSTASRSAIPPGIDAGQLPRP